MKTIGDKLEAFSVTGVKPGFNQHEENGVSAFETITEKSFPGKWKVIYFWPKDFTFVCPTEIVGFDKLARQFEERDAVLMGGSTDNEFSKLGWRRDHKDLSSSATGASATRRARSSTSSACATRPKAWRCARPSSSTPTTRSST